MKIEVNPRMRPRTISEYQKMFAEIYPPSRRSLEHAGIHLAEEVGELSEAVLQFRGRHSEEDFNLVVLEASDLYSCMMGVMNSLGVDYEKELVGMFSKGCHICRKSPCVCDYQFVINFKS
jgi:NTP pyrophosphatase (non-canonical NTP hydrolase)